jgi:hypothetical protein
MRLTIAGTARDLIPIQQFRQRYGLSARFGMAQFEPKDFTGLAVIDNAGAEMNDLRQSLLDAIPPKLTIATLPTVFEQLRAMFRAGMYAINDRIKLKPAEIEFAVAGFNDVNQAWLYALARHPAAHRPPPAFMTVYQQWLDDSVRVSTQVHTMPHAAQTWQIRIINYAYGRVGLCVDIDATCYYVQDAVYACPAEGYMLALLREIATRTQQRLSVS